MSDDFYEMLLLCLVQIVTHALESLSAEDWSSAWITRAGSHRDAYSPRKEGRKKERNKQTNKKKLPIIFCINVMKEG
jgi:hypothetical protein